MQILAIPKKKRIYAIAFSPSGRDLAAISGDGKIRIWDTRTGELRNIGSVEDTSSGFDVLYLNDHSLAVAGVHLFHWDLANNEWTIAIRGGRWARQLALSPDGKYLAEADQTTSTDWANTGLIVFDPVKWLSLVRAGDSGNSSGGLAYSPDGQWLASSHIVRVGGKTRSYGEYGTEIENTYDYVVHIRDLPSQQTVRSIAGWGQGVKHLAFSPDGTTLAGTAGPRLRVWDLVNDREIAKEQRGSKHFQGLAFTQEGRYVATVSNDTTVRIWDTRTWKESNTYVWQVGRLLNLAIAPDGLRAAAGSDSGKIIIWDLDE